MCSTSCGVGLLLAGENLQLEEMQKVEGISDGVSGTGATQAAQDHRDCLGK